MKYFVIRYVLLLCVGDIQAGHINLAGGIYRYAPVRHPDSAMRFRVLETFGELIFYQSKRNGNLRGHLNVLSTKGIYSALLISDKGRGRTYDTSALDCSTI